MQEFLAVLTNIFSNPLYIPALILGTSLGVCFGAMPGLTAPMGIAVLLPLTYALDATIGLAMLLGMYCGAVYGGSLTAILINIPGTPSSVMTALDGYALACRGEAGKALGIATLASVIGGLFSAVCLMTIAPILSRLALKFGPQEYFALSIFGLSVIVSISGKAICKGITAGLFGVLITTVGLDPITSTPRFTYDLVNLMSGLPFIPMMIGLFGLREVLLQTEKGLQEYHAEQQKLRSVIPDRKLFAHVFRPITWGSIIGTLVGALPGAGGPIAAFLSYDSCQRMYKGKGSECQFGEGCIEGIAAAESAKNAVTGGALIPLLTLSIPGDAATAIMLGAFMMHDLSPGPLLFRNHVDIVYGIYLSLFLANLILLIIGLSSIPLFIRILDIKIAVLLPIILVMCVVGSYAVRNSMFDVVVMMAFGGLGFFMTKLGIPNTPMVLGIVLGPIIEQNLRQGLLIENGNWFRLMTRPLSGLILTLTLVIVLWSILRNSHVADG